MGLSISSQIHTKLIQGSCPRSSGPSQAFPPPTGVSQEQLQNTVSRDPEGLVGKAGPCVFSS